MSREIKFRVWQKYHKKMLEVLDIGFKDGKVNSVKVKYPEDTIPPIVTYKKNDKKFWLDDDCIKLMEYTGLKDKNGKEIYEGDIVRVTYKKAAPKYKIQDRKVIFNDGAYWLTNSEGTSLTRLSNVRVLFDVISNVESLEVIGNIYENPELLEVNKNE